MNTQPVPTFLLGYEHLEGKSIEEVIDYLINDEETMLDYDSNWWTAFAEDSISTKNESVAEPTENLIVNQIWEIAKNQTDFVYSGKLFYACATLI